MHLTHGGHHALFHGFTVCEWTSNIQDAQREAAVVFSVGVLRGSGQKMQSDFLWPLWDKVCLETFGVSGASELSIL